MKTILMLTLALMASAANAEWNDEAAKALREKVGARRLGLALALTEAFDAKAVCDAEAYPTDIVKEVALAKSQVKPRTFTKFLAQLNPKSEMRANFAFREAIGQINLYNPDLTEAQLTKALVGTKFYHFGQGAYGSGYNVTLRANGVADEKIMDVLNEEPWFRWKGSRTTWSLVRDEKAPQVGFYLVLGGKRYEFERGENDVQWIPVGVDRDSVEYFQNTLNAADSYCDA